ncbi:MAG TPA: MauE/DoxX family redox-associated membrane protein [Methylophilaceae bacterium]|nr:MauE/DoxX family redox-associated membrane protein [Methylophilaceae bacterium]
MELTALLSLGSVAGTTFLVLLLLGAMLHKLGDIERFYGFLANYQLLPEALVKVSAHLLILAEGLIMAMLLIPALNQLGAWMAIALLMLYATAITINLLRGNVHIECGCGGPAIHLSYGLLLRNLLIALVALPSAISSHTQLNFIDAGIGILCGVILCLVYTVAEQLIANFSHAQTLSQAKSFN